MSINLLAVIAVALISASPIGEILTAIPVGIGLGMDPVLAFMIAYPANLLPIAILLPILGSLDSRFPRFFDYFARRSGRFQKHLEGKYGAAVLFLITPIIGVYATSITSKFLRFGKKRSFILQSLSVALFGAVEATGLYFGIQLIAGL